MAVVGAGGLSILVPGEVGRNEPALAGSRSCWRWSVALGGPYPLFLWLLYSMALQKDWCIAR